MTGSSVQSRELGPCQSRTANMSMDVQFSTKQKSMLSSFLTILFDRKNAHDRLPCVFDAPLLHDFMLTYCLRAGWH